MEGDLIGKTSDDAQFMSFQDFSPINRAGGAGQAQIDITSPSQHFGDLRSHPDGIGNMEAPPRSLPIDDAEVQRSFWTIEYYQKYFNVDTVDVLDRLKRSMLPNLRENYLLTRIRPNPDLYGPFWVCVTLVFSIAVSGNMANYLQTANNGKYHWRYDFHLVSYAATCIFLYAWLLPMILWAALKWVSEPEDADIELVEPNKPPGLMELLCLYGYSLAIYIPIAFLWTIQISWIQWSLVGFAALLSGGVLLHSLSPIITGKQKPIFFAAILGMHLLLAAGFMLFFFHVPSISSSPVAEHVVAEVVQNASIANSAPKVAAVLPHSILTTPSAPKH